jgi:hypothetical protein
VRRCLDHDLQVRRVSATHITMSLCLSPKPLLIQPHNPLMLSCFDTQIIGTWGISASASRMSEAFADKQVKEHFVNHSSARCPSS